MLRDGDVVAGRFEVIDDDQRLRRALASKVGAASPAAEGDPHDGTRLRRGIDRQTGAAVVFEEPPAPYLWATGIERAATAKRVLTTPSSATVPVLHLGACTVFAHPPAGLARESFTAAEAAALAIEACEVVASLHGGGVRPRAFDARSLRVVRVDGQLAIRWLVPGVITRFEPEPSARKPRSRTSYVDREQRQRDAVRWDVRMLSGLFEALLSTEDLSVATQAITGIEDAANEAVPASVAAFAELLLPFVSSSESLAARVVALPVIRALPPLALDWSEVITDGEARLADASLPKHYRVYIELPLAAAYHQRASRAAAAGEIRAALSDANRAVVLDRRHLPYLTTRAVLLDRHRWGSEIVPVLNRALVEAASSERRPYGHEGYEHATDSELARAHAARGMIALRAGKLTEAERDLQRAMDLHATALYAHSLGAARYGLGNLAGAAEAEAVSVALEPENPRYRWALIGSLLKLQRDAEAREHAQTILEQEPEIAAHRARFDRVFGSPSRSDDVA